MTEFTARNYRDAFARRMDGLTAVNRLTTPEQVLHEYTNLVGQSRGGYDWELAEYRNDMSIRDTIETLLSSGELADFPEFDRFQGRVAALDELLDEALTEERFPTKWTGWWHERLPIRASGVFLEELFVLHDYRAIDADSEG